MAIKKYHVSKNLFNINGHDTNNGYIADTQLNSDGTTSTWGSAEVSEYIPIDGGMTYTFNGIGSYNAPSYCVYDSNKQYIAGYKYSGRSVITFTAIENAKYVRFTHIKAYTRAMFVKGTIMPTEFEPYGNIFKNWFYRKRETATDTITTFPKQIIADGQSASAVIKGNLSQSGTPTPSSPIYPSETGDKTANLFDYKSVYASYININGDIATMANNITAWNSVSQEWVGKTITISCYVKSIDASYIRVQGQVDGAYITGNAINSGQTGYTEITITPVSTSDRWRITYGSGTVNVVINQVMVEESSTRTAYQPYGYKIPILSGGTTTNVYLGEVQSTRQIKKLVLTGEETPTWAAIITDTDAYQFPNETSGYKREQFICSHMPVNTYITTTNTHGYIGQRLTLCFDKSMGLDTTAKVQQYLADQYSNGTPVTVWYVLAEPTTGILNEPLRKIGNYADSVSVTGIPTTGTAEQFDVQTDLKPSEVDLTYHGWHEHNDTKF